METTRAAGAGAGPGRPDDAPLAPPGRTKTRGEKAGAGGIPVAARLLRT